MFSELRVVFPNMQFVCFVWFVCTMQFVANAQPPDVPAVPAVDETPPAPASSNKRKHDGPVGDDARAEDPADPAEDGTVGALEESRVLMLGERRKASGKLGEGSHPGRFEVCELFSPPRVLSLIHI